jgi:hypothetical protein
MRHSILTFSVILLLCSVVLPPHVGAQQAAPTPTATPRPDERPDACEPNDDPRRACALPLDAVSGPFTFVPEGDRDYYSLNLGAEPTGLETTVTVRATPGLDLITTITRADTAAPVGQISTPAISTTLSADLTGWMLLRVENRAPGLASGQSYRIEVRRTLPPTPDPIPATGPEGLERPEAAPDVLENTYSVETAAPIGVGVLYDLNFVCPVPNGCPGGDHDYLRFEAKAGTRYLISTFDLAPGVDTVLDLFWYDAARGWQVLATNDDARPGFAFLSTLRWQAPGDGPVIVRVAPRTGGLNPILVGDTTVPTYRVAVALAESDLAAQIEERIAVQTGVPPTPTPETSAAAPTAPAQNPASGAEAGGTPATAPATAPVAPTPVPMSDTAGTGQAILTQDAPAYTDPDPASILLADLPPDAVVTLTGRVSGVWVEVTSEMFIGTAWMDRRRLRPIRADATPVTEVGTPSAAQPNNPPVITVPNTPPPAPPAPGSTSGVSVRPLTPAASAAPASAASSTQALVQVRIVSGDDARPVAGMRVVMMNALGDELVAVVTDARGEATLSALVAVDTAIDVVVPAIGVQHRVSMATPSVTIQLPEVR